MQANPGKIESHDRGIGQQSLVYPVISRRSQGLSLGINLFPDRKLCDFDCPYCEVKPFSSDVDFSPANLKNELEKFFEIRYPAEWAPLPLKDICISGNGEPTLSPWLAEALELCAWARKTYTAPIQNVKIVLITNSTGFMNESVSATLREAVRREDLDIWAKLDAGSAERFSLMSRSGFSLDSIARGVGAFSEETPLTIQTMLCEAGGSAPDESEARAYADRVNVMLSGGSKIRALQFYTIARAPLEPSVQAIPISAMLDFIRIVRARIVRPIGISGYGQRGERIDLP